MSTDIAPGEFTCSGVDCENSFYLKQQRIDRCKSGFFFCSAECKNRALSIGMRDDDSVFTALVPAHYRSAKPSRRFCRICSTELKGRQRKYCSFECKKVGHLPASERYNEWKAAGDSSLASSPVSGGLLNSFRRRLKEEAGNVCSLCGWGEVSANGTVPVEIDHIDGDWRNNAYENLRVICPNCHSLTANWKNYNTTDESRYKYYKKRGWW